MSNRIKYIKKAQEITDKVFTAILPFIKPGVTEEYIARKIKKLIIKNGGDKQLAFKPLVCSGKRTALFHGPTSKRKIKNNEPVYLDFGAKYKGWCADLTRTIFIGKPNKRLLEIYNIVKKVQKKQINMVKPGVRTAEIDRKGREILKQYNLDKYFIHSTGHGVGKQVHQKPRISFKSNELLKAGQVITIEPGIYIKGLGGVRLEDMILVAKPSLNLTKSKK